jgi:excisionase family DNA binding protein
MAASDGAVADRLLTVGEVAELLGTTERFPRRLIAERRIEFVKIGRYVRIRESTLRAFIEAGRVEALTVADIWPRQKGAA